MNAKEPAGSEEVKFEDLDLVYIVPFDLGTPVEAEDLRELLEFFGGYEIVEGIWIPPKEVRLTPQFVYRKAKELGIKDPKKIGIEELMKNGRLWEEINRAHAMFREIVSADESMFDPEYLELGRFGRIKLTDLNMSIEDEELSYLNELKCELYLLLHSAGVGVLTVWIHLNGNFSTDDLIKIEEKLYYKAECTIKDPFRNIVEGTLRGFIEQNIIRPVQAAVLFKGEYGGYDKAFYALERGDITGDKINEKLRTLYFPVRIVVCIRKHSCNYKCETAEEAVENHLRELAGILAHREDWRRYQMDAAKEILGKNLSSDMHYAMFMAIGTSLFIGSTMLEKGLENVVDKELVYRRYEPFLVHPVEFLQLLEMFLETYISAYQRKSEEFWRRGERGESVRPSEVMKMRSKLIYGLEEYDNISFLVWSPFRRIVEYGKERLGLSNKVNVLKSGLQELSDMARTLYEEETLREQIDLSRKQVLLAILFGIFGAFQALAYFEPKIGLLYALAVTSAILLLSYLFYELYPYIRGKLHLFRRRRKAG